ncbi:protein TBATA-like isoform X2 [Babylonia areolata]|uniref:protein TBATA-like isoform X2 n=1 Tax=Babylonia areolata TaxID=304850 RepID=UPI003FD4B9FE
MTSEVQQLRGEGAPAPPRVNTGDVFRPRPATQGGGTTGYRFGQLSHNSFFTRHNPHPNRVRHLKGLLDVPICSVNDDGYFSSPRYSLQFPPNHFNNNKINKWKGGRIPVNTVNVNSNLHHINTVTGLQYFMGLNSYPWRERAIPRVGLVPVTEAWRDELKRFAEQLGDGVTLTKDPAKDSLPKDEERPRTTLYSQETGRLIPPPSRAMSRGHSRRGQRTPNSYPSLQHIAPVPDVENVVLTMLCQILQTEDINAVQAWLCSAGDTEKTMVMEMIKAAMAGREEYWKQYPAHVMDPATDVSKTKLPPIDPGPRPPTGEINRLVLEQSAPPVDTVMQPPKSPVRTVVDDRDFAIEAPTNSVFRPPSPPKKPASQQSQRPATNSAPQAVTMATAAQDLAPKPSSPDARTKQTKTKEPLPDSLAVWNQTESLNTF